MVATTSSDRGRGRPRRLAVAAVAAVVAAAAGSLLAGPAVTAASAHGRGHGHGHGPQHAGHGRRHAGHGRHHAGARRHPGRGATHAGGRRGATCVDATATVAHASRGEMQAAVVCLINEQRAAHHLPALRADQRLDRSAQSWTNAMISGSNFSHGSAFQNRISAAGFDWSSVGENIATGYRTPTAVVRAWMASTGHCQNILSPVFGEVGTGVSDADIRHASSIEGTWTQDFALRMGQHQPSHDTAPQRGCPYRT